MFVLLIKNILKNPTTPQLQDKTKIPGMENVTAIVRKERHMLMVVSDCQELGERRAEYPAKVKWR